MTEIIKVADYEELSKTCSQIMLDLVKNNPAANICLASGGSPDLAYELFTKAVLDKKVNVSNIAHQLNLPHTSTFKILISS